MPAGRDMGGVGLRVKVAALALPALCGAVPAALVVVAAALVGASVGLVERLGLELELEGLGSELGLGSKLGLRLGLEVVWFSAVVCAVPAAAALWASSLELVSGAASTTASVLLVVLARFEGLNAASWFASKWLHCPSVEMCRRLAC